MKITKISINRQCDDCRWFWGGPPKCHNYASEAERRGDTYCALYESKQTYEKFRIDGEDDDYES